MDRQLYTYCSCWYSLKGLEKNQITRSEMFVLTTNNLFGFKKSQGTVMCYASKSFGHIKELLELICWMFQNKCGSNGIVLYWLHFILEMVFAKEPFCLLPRSMCTWMICQNNHMGATCVVSSNRLMCNNDLAHMVHVCSSYWSYRLL